MLGEEATRCRYRESLGRRVERIEAEIVSLRSSTLCGAAPRIPCPPTRPLGSNAPAFDLFGGQFRFRDCGSLVAGPDGATPWAFDAMEREVTPVLKAMEEVFAQLECREDTAREDLGDDFILLKEDVKEWDESGLPRLIETVTRIPRPASSVTHTDPPAARTGGAETALISRSSSVVPSDMGSERRYASVRQAPPRAAMVVGSRGSISSECVPLLPPIEPRRLETGSLLSAQRIRRRSGNEFSVVSPASSVRSTSSRASSVASTRGRCSVNSDQAHALSELFSCTGAVGPRVSSRKSHLQQLPLSQRGSFSCSGGASLAVARGPLPTGRGGPHEAALRGPSAEEMDYVVTRTAIEDPVLLAFCQSCGHAAGFRIYVRQSDPQLAVDERAPSHPEFVLGAGLESYGCNCASREVLGTPFWAERSDATPGPRSGTETAPKAPQRQKDGAYGSCPRCGALQLIIPAMGPQVESQKAQSRPAAPTPEAGARALQAATVAVAAAPAVVESRPPGGAADAAYLAELAQFEEAQRRAFQSAVEEWRRGRTSD